MSIISNAVADNNTFYKDVTPNGVEDGGVMHFTWFTSRAIKISTLRV